MVNYKIARTELAENDLKEIALHIAITNSIEVAYKIVNEIEKSILQLENMPKSGSQTKFKFSKACGYRFLVVEKYLIHYHIDETSKTVYIDRIRHGAIAPKNQL